MVILLLFTKILNVLINFRWKWSMVSHTARRGGRISTKFMKRIKEEARSLLKFQTVSRTRWDFLCGRFAFFSYIGFNLNFLFHKPWPEQRRRKWRNQGSSWIQSEVGYQHAWVWVLCQDNMNVIFQNRGCDKVKY